VDYSEQIERMVEEPTWRSMLAELILRHKLDPWDIDLDVLADHFMKRIRELKDDRFTVPGNVILACSILYKFKTLMLRINEEDEQPVDMSFDINDVKDLVARPARKRPITIVELMRAMEKAMKYEPKIGVAIAATSEKTKRTIDELMEAEYVYEYNEDDMSSRLETVIGKIKKASDSEGVTLFSSILDEKGVVHSLLPVLFLANEGLLDLKQDKIFGEIIIRYRDVAQHA